MTQIRILFLIKAQPLLGEDQTPLSCNRLLLVSPSLFEDCDQLRDIIPIGTNPSTVLQTAIQPFIQYTVFFTVCVKIIVRSDSR